MIVMYDSIDLQQIPLQPEAVAGYVNGRWPTYPEVVRRWPRSHHLSIAVTAQAVARCLDVEPGDATPAQAPGWFRTHAIKTQGKPVLYCSASTINQVVSVMSAADIGRGSYLIWSAHYTRKEHICAPGVCGFPQADATQWTDHAQGKNLDQSCCSDSFFPGTTPKPPPAPKDTVSMDVATLPDGRQEIFVELKSGEVLHRWNAKDGGWVPAWYSLGRPG